MTYKFLNHTADLKILVSEKNLEKALKNQDEEMKGGMNMEQEQKTVDTKTKDVKVVKEKKVSMCSQVAKLVAENKTNDEIQKTLNISNKRVLDIKWQLKNKK